VRPSGSEIPNLTGQLLVAHPSLRGPNFRKTVLFLSAHDPQDGAHGLVINRPTNKESVAKRKIPIPQKLSVPKYLRING
jgi:putative AlgH/UPF0301 family transcriptional regulator